RCWSAQASSRGPAMRKCGHVASTCRRSGKPMTGSRNTAAFGKSVSIGSTTIFGQFRRRVSRTNRTNGRSRVAVKSSIDLEKDPRSIIGKRVLSAPRALVFSVWSDPKHLAQWWGPNGFTTTTRTFDFRPGGVWRFVMHGPDGRDYQNRITFDEILAPERIVYRHDGAEDVEPVCFTQTVTFEDLGNGETRLTWHGRFPSAEERTRVIREYGADKGLVQTMARLDDYLAALVTELT